MHRTIEYNTVVLYSNPGAGGRTLQVHPVIHASGPVFAVKDVRETVAYYRTVLGFESEWLWGEPPTFGGMCWGRIQVMFCQQPAL